MSNPVAIFDEGNGSRTVELLPGVLGMSERWLASNGYGSKDECTHSFLMYATWKQAKAQQLTESATYEQFEARLIAWTTETGAEADPTTTAAPAVSS